MRLNLPSLQRTYPWLYHTQASVRLFFWSVPRMCYVRVFWLIAHGHQGILAGSET